MIKRELAKDPELAKESWERFLPKFKKKNVKRAKPNKKEMKKKSDSPFPPAPTMSKVDLALESGEYFLKKEQRQRTQQAAKEAAQAERTEERQKKRKAMYVAPKEKEKAAGGGDGDAVTRKAERADLDQMAAKLKVRSKNSSKKAAAKDAAGFVMMS